MLIALGIILAILLLWVLFLRRWLKSHGYAQGFFTWVEPIESAVYKKSETILWARLQQLAGFILAFLPIVGAFDVTPFLVFLPENHRWWVASLPGAAVSLNGVITELLRRNTTKPLDVVALPENAPREVQQAVARAEIAKDAAAVEIQIAKEEQKI